MKRGVTGHSHGLRIANVILNRFQKNLQLSQFHPEFLAKRFENEYEYKRSKYYEMLKNKGDLLKQQDSINVTRDKVSYIINLFDMPIDDILDEIRNQLKTTEPRDQMLWVRVSPKVVESKPNYEVLCFQTTVNLT